MKWERETQGTEVESFGRAWTNGKEGAKKQSARRRSYRRKYENLEPGVSGGPSKKKKLLVAEWFMIRGPHAISHPLRILPWVTPDVPQKI